MGAALFAGADKTNHDSIIRANDAAGRWRLGLAVNGRFKNVRADSSGSGGGSRGFFDE